MKSFSKIGAIFLLTASIVSTTSITAFAWQNVTKPEGGSWTYGINQPGNGWEQGYSYYYHGSKSHGSSVTHDGKVVADSGKYAKGTTSIANAPSVRVGKYDTALWYRFL